MRRVRPVVHDSPKIGHSIREVSRMLGVSEGHIVNLVKRGQLPVRRLGRRVIVLVQDLNSYLGGARG
jgi:excisionase family DNA binding protein